MPSVGLEHRLDNILSEITKQKTESGMKAIRLIGQLLDDMLHEEDEEKQTEVLQAFTHY
ncbi:hypothetical protein [Bacillus pumilus]|uniref:hypothetical protein n=1 Tax=Bacillus pumilus TaxID=1408 RepID=UPI0021B25430|nr:hypothetical protein [Bacillus pumilus]